MAKKTFEYYSLNYLNQWLSHDKQCFEILNDKVSGDKLETLKKGAVFYKIARSLRWKDKEPETNRYQPILEQLDDISHQDLETDLVGQTTRIVDELKEVYGQRMLSATTKFLWLKFRGPNYIYDSQAFASLKAKNKNLRAGDLKSFRQEWSASYNEHESHIREACANLICVRQYAFDPNIGNEYLEKDIQKEWFYQRVHDLYLQDREGA